MRAEFDISILTVGYNSRKYLPAMLNSLAPAAGNISYEVLFVDNGTDGSEEWVARTYSDVKVLPSLGNIGFGAANNYLAGHVSGRWLLLLNPDTKLFPGSVEALFRAAAMAKDYAVLGGISVDAEGDPLNESRLAFPTFLGLLQDLLLQRRRGAVLNSFESVEPVDAVSGGFMLVDRLAWLDLEGFDETYFLYAEELDFCQRLKIQGGRVASVSAARMYHDVGAGARFSPSRQLYVHLGLATYLRRHLGASHRYACLAVQWSRCVARFAIGRVMSPFSQRFALLADAYKDIALRPWRWMRGYPDRN